MILRKQMYCFECRGLGDLHWETISQNNLTVHNVPIYRCKCGAEWYELSSAAVYDHQVEKAYERNLEEITLEYPEITYLEWDEPVSDEMMEKIMAELGMCEGESS